MTEKKTLTRSEALQALVDGKKVRHKDWLNDQWVQLDKSGTILVGWNVR